MLYVPQGTKQNYETDAGWRRAFAHIVEMGTTDIHSTRPGTDGVEELFDLQGRRVPASVLQKNNSRNIYLLKEKNGSVRKIIKR